MNTSAPEPTCRHSARSSPPSRTWASRWGFDAVALMKYPHLERIEHIHHAGNSSGIVDGAAALLIGNKAFGEKHGLTPRARIRATAKIGTDPTIMLTGPVPATEKILKDSGMAIGDIDLFEVNEAFSSVVLRFMQAFDVDADRVNVNGGAIAMGHPLGATGAIILGTLLDELERSGKGTGLATLCVASGMGAATIISGFDGATGRTTDMTDFTYSVDAEGVAIITWDVPGKSMNVLARDAFSVVKGHLDRALADDAVKGIVITSGKDSFAGGMDLNVLASIRDEAGEAPAQALFDFIMEGHRILRKIERAGMDPRTGKGGKPVACAITGTCAGIGTEIALACHRRFMADRPKARIGLPEILVGLFPGAGGTTRYSRMVGAMAASPVLLEGRMLEPQKARQASLIDEVVAPEELLAKAKDWVLSATDADIVKPWDQKGWKMPGGAPYHPAGFMTFVGASAMVNGKTQGVYPAAQALLSAVYEGALVPFDTALMIEARWFTKILMDPTSSAMIRSLFLNKEALEKGANRPDVPDQKVRKLGVLGAGMMGAGIAHVSAGAGIEVVLIDRTQDAADAGKAHAEALLDKAIARRKATPEQRAETLGRIAATTDFAALDGCDLVVEAVFEDMEVKAGTTRNAEAHLPGDAIFATNTSTLPITELAKASRSAERFIGIHFF